MTLEELMWVTNDSAIVEVYANTELIARYDGKDSIPDRYGDEEVTDIFVDKVKGTLCVEIDIEPDLDYMD